MIGRIRCRLYGHIGWQSQNQYGSWTKPRCPRCKKEKKRR